MIACQKCGHENPLGRIFCYQCGERLDLKSVKPPEQARKFWRRARHEERKKQGRTLSQIVWRWTKVLIFLGLLACLVLIFCPPDMKVISRNAGIEASAKDKMSRLRKALITGTSETVDFTEDELHALIPEMNADAGSSGFGTYQGETRQLEIGDGRLTSIIVGHLSFGSVLSLPVVVKLSGELSAKNGVLVFDERALQVGRLPISRLLFPAFRFLMNRMANFWEEQTLKSDRELLARARSIRVQGEKLVVVTGDSTSVAPTPRFSP